MRRTVTHLTAAIVVVILAWPISAEAKGQNLRVKVTGPRLTSPIRLRGDDAQSFVEASGIEQVKWDRPNVDGTLRSEISLGPPYRVSVSLDCEGSTRSVFTMTLYPLAQGGPQVLVAPRTRFCGGATIEPGWWPMRADTLTALVRAGLPRPPETSAPIPPAGVGVGRPVVADGSVAGWVAGLVLTLALLVTVTLALIRRRLRA